MCPHIIVNYSLKDVETNLNLHLMRSVNTYISKKTLMVNKSDKSKQKITRIG